MIIEENQPVAPAKWKSEIVALAGLLAAYLWIRWDGVIVASTHLIGGATRDAGLYYWLVQDFAAGPLRALWNDSSAFYPYGLSRAWSDNFLLPSLLWWVISACGLGGVLAYNLLLLGAGFANGACTFFALRSVRVTVLNAFCGALGFQSLSYFTTNLGHPQLQFAFFLPLAVAVSVRLVQSTSWRPAFAIGLLLSTSLLTTAYYSVFVAVVICATVLSAILLGTPAPSILARGRQVLSLGCGIAPVLFAVPFYTTVKDVFSSRGLYEAYYFSAQPISFLSYGPFHRFFGASAKFSHPEGWLGGGAALFVAFVASKILIRKIFSRSLVLWIGALIVFFATLVFVRDRIIQAAASWMLCCCCLILIRRSRGVHSSFEQPARLFFTSASLCAIAGVVLAFGPLGNPEKGQYPLGVFSLFYMVFPGFDALRAVARFGLIALMGLSLVTAGAIEAISHRSRRVGQLIALLLSVAILFEAQHSAFPIETIPPIPKVLDTKIPPGTPTIFLPFSAGISRGSVESWGEYARLSTTYMQWGTDRGLKIVNGYSGQRSKLMIELPADTESFPSQKALDRISTIAGLKFVVVVAAEMKDSGWRNRLDQYDQQLKIVSEDSRGNVILQFSPRLSFGAGTPLGLLLPANGAAQVEVRVDETPDCPIQWGFAKATTVNSLREALTHPQYTTGSTLAVPLPPNRFNVRPRVLALDSPCKRTLTSSRIELPREAW